MRYKNHVMIFYLSLNCSITVLAYEAFITTQYFRIFLVKLFLFGVILIIQLFTLGKFNKILTFFFNIKFIQVIKVLKIVLNLFGSLV